MRKYYLASVVVALLVACGLATAGEHTVTLQQGQEVYGQTYTGTGDSQIYDWTADTNYGRRPETKTGGNDKKRLLVQFKIFASEGGPVPDGATVTSATMKLYKINGNDYGPYNVYRVLKSWNEIEVTWNSAASGDAWNTPGCSGAGTDRSTNPVATPSVSSGWMDVDITSCVQAYAGGTATNNGWLLVDSYGNYRTWASRDYNTDTSLRPKLEITYTGNTDPVAKAYALPQKGIAPFAVTFDASASEDVDGTIVSFSWSFGDGSDPEEGERVEHTYSTADTYTATLTITDDEGGVDTLDFEITAFDLNEVYTVTYQEGQDAGGSTYDGTRDASMYSPHPDSNYDSSSETFRSASSFRPIISFKVFDDQGWVVPRGAEIVSATLYMYKTSSYSIFPEMHQLKKTFVEGEVTWNNASTAEAWESGGASGSEDRLPTAVANPWMGWDPGWLLSDVTSSVASMSDGAANDGWVFTDSYSNIRHFASRENTDTTIRPKLVITYRRKPTAVIATTPDPPKGLTPCTIQFDGSGSTDPDGTILFHYWNFGDGEIGEGEVVSHTYTQAGCFKATLTITDDQGATASASVFVGVADEGSGTEDITLQDGLDGYAGTEDTYLDSWSADTARGDSVDLRYRKDKYNPLVKFKIFTTEGGAVNAARRVKDAKLSLYKYSAYDSTMGAKRLLKAWTEAAATWNKFDGTTAWATPGAKGVGTDVATGEEPLVSMGWDPTWVEFPVTEDVEGFRLGAASNNGWHIWRYWGNTNTKKFHSSEYATDTTLRPKLVLQISDNAAPVASAEADVVLGSPPLAVQFTGTGIDVDGSIASWSWDFDDGSDPSSDQNPIHSYTASGRYTATLTVTDDGGLTAQASVLIEVEEPYDLTFQEDDGGTYSDTEDCNLKESHPTKNEAGGDYLGTQSEAGNVRRALIRFPDIIGHNAGQIPHDAKIVSAKIRLTKTSTLADQQIAVFRITEDWSIPYSTPKWATRRAGGATWGGVGCSFVDADNQSHLEEAEDVQVMDGRPFPYEWDVTAAVQTWANDADTNHGLVVEALTGSMSFRSSDHDAQELRPILLVTLSDLPDNQNPKLAITTQQPTSQTKRAFVEGTKDPEVDTINLTADGQAVEVTVTNPTKWHAFVERDGSDSVAIVATATDSTGNQTQVTETLTYTPEDAASPTGILMQAGDSALMMVNSGHPNADSVQIVPGDGGSNVTGALGATLEVPYNTAGEYTATVNVLDISSTVLETHQVSVTAVSVTMKPGFALGVKQGPAMSGPEPEYEVEVTPASAASLVYLLTENEDLLTVKPREITATGVQSKVILETPSTPHVQARLGGLIGRVIGRDVITGFSMSVSDFFGNRKTRKGNAFVQISPFVPGAEIELELGMGATFTDGFTKRTYSSDDFEEDGTLVFEAMVPKFAPDFEVTVRVYKALSSRQHVARLYDNGIHAFLGLQEETFPAKKVFAQEHSLHGEVELDQGKEVSPGWPGGTIAWVQVKLVNGVTGQQVVPAQGTGNIRFKRWPLHNLERVSDYPAVGIDTMMKVTDDTNTLSLAPGYYDAVVTPQRPLGGKSVKFTDLIVVNGLVPKSGALVAMDDQAFKQAEDSQPGDDPLPVLYVHQGLGDGPYSLSNSSFTFQFTPSASGDKPSNYVWQVRDTDPSQTWDESWLLGNLFHDTDFRQLFWGHGFIFEFPQELYLEAGKKTDAQEVEVGGETYYKLPSNAVMRRIKVKIVAIKMEYVGGTRANDGKVERYKPLNGEYFMKGYMLRVSIPSHYVKPGTDVDWMFEKSDSAVGDFYAQGTWVDYGSQPLGTTPTTARVYWRSDWIADGAIDDEYEITAAYTDVNDNDITVTRTIKSRRLLRTNAAHRDRFNEDVDMVQRALIQVFGLAKGDLVEYQIGQYQDNSTGYYRYGSRSRTFSKVADEVWNFDHFVINTPKGDSSYDLESRHVDGIWKQFALILQAGNLGVINSADPSYDNWITNAAEDANLTMPANFPKSATDLLKAHQQKEDGRQTPRHSLAVRPPLAINSVRVGWVTRAAGNTYTDWGLGFGAIQPYNTRQDAPNLYRPIDNTYTHAMIMKDNVDGAPGATGSEKVWRAFFKYRHGSYQASETIAQLRAYPAEDEKKKSADYADGIFTQWLEIPLP